MSDSVSFDRAAGTYDKTRALPPEAHEAMIALLTSELRGRRVLEIGVGTGRIAIPLADAGVPVVGIDLSATMLSKMRAKPGAVPAAIADATRLPFSEGCFEGAVVCHVFHLIPKWREAVLELRRTVRGPVLVELGGATSPYKEISAELLRRAGLTQRHPGLDVWNTEGARDDLDDAFGVAHRDLEPIAVRESLTLDRAVADFEDGTYSWAWQVPPERRAPIAAEVREWTRERYGPLDTPQNVVHQLTWRAYDV